MAVLLDNLSAKIASGEPLTDTDVDALGSSRDIIALGMLANSLRRKIHGSSVTFVRVLDLKLPKERWPNEVPSTAGEVRIFQTPGTLDAAVEVAQAARDLAGTTPLSAFCLFELSTLPEGLPVVLSALRSARVDLIAQAPIDRLTSPGQALEALTDAGLRLSRLTVDKTPERPWTDVCREVAAHQARLGQIRVFAPLARQIDPTQPTTGYDDVKRIAISRLVADNVDTIQVDWALYGPKLAQVALTFGADDIDSVSIENDDSHGHRRSPIEEIHRSVRAAGFEPVERDGRFQRR